MPPKPGKKGAQKTPNSAGKRDVNKNWEAGLTTAQFEEDSWRACVSLVVGESPEDEALLTRALALAAQQPLRKLFSVLTWDNTQTKIHELGNPKAKKADDLPNFYEVTEEAKAVLDAGNEIHCNLMAKVLKFLLLQIKANDQRRREAEQAVEEKGNDGPPTANKDKGGGKGAQKDKKGKGPPSPVLPPVDKKTKLKRRDDVEPPKFIDDEPDNGPQHYILVTGFHQPFIIGALDAIGVHVANVIKLCSLQEEHGPASDTEDFRSKEPKTLDLFWCALKPVLNRGPVESKLHDVVELSYTYPHVLPQEYEADLEIGTQIFEGVASLIYDSLDWRRQHQHYRDNMDLISVPAVVGLNAQPAEVVVVPPPTPATPRTKKKLLQAEIPLCKEPEQPPLTTDVDMRYYCHLLDIVPPEACSVPLLLHCLLEQVVISTQPPSSAGSNVSEEPKPASGSGLDPELLGFMLQSFLPLVRTQNEKDHLVQGLLAQAQTEEDKKMLAETFAGEEQQEKPQQPLVIRHHDERTMRLRETSVVQGFDPAEVELSMLRLSPVWDLIHCGAPQRNSGSSWMALKHQLQHHCTDEVLSWPEVERLFNQSVFESMPLTGLDQRGVLSGLETHQQKPAIIPWDDPLSYAQQQLLNLRNKGPTFLTEDPAKTEQSSGRVSCQLELSDIQSCRLRSLFDWHYSERHSASVFPQVLQAASEEYRCLDSLRGSHNNCLYIFCHNPMSPGRQCNEFWDVALHTDVRFRRYLEHVADGISDWTKEEELKRETLRLRDLSPIESAKDETASNSAEDEEDALKPVIREDSLKAWKLKQEQLKEEESAKKPKKENTPRGKQRQEEVKPADKKSKTVPSGKKSKAERAETSTESLTNPGPAENTIEPNPKEEPSKCFRGYSMDGRLVQVSGRLQHLFPSDGGRIIMESACYAEGSSLMKVAVKKDGHRFCTHINFSEHPLRPHSEESKGPRELVLQQGSLSAVLDSGIHLSYSFFGPTGECPVIQDLMTSKTSESQEPSPPAFRGLSLSVPSGLLVQFLREDMPGVSPEEQGLLVKQSFPLHGGGAAGQIPDSSLSRELSRTVTSQGTVIRHLRDGSTQILFPDGSVSFSPDSGPVWVPDSEVRQESEDNKEEQEEGKRGCWTTTTPCGERVCTVGTTHKKHPTTPLLVFRTTDPITHEVMLNREDLVVSVQSPDGSQRVEHADGTRITTLYNDTLELQAGELPESLPVHSASAPECVSDTHSAAGSRGDQDTQDGPDETSGGGEACPDEAESRACEEDEERACEEDEERACEEDEERACEEDKERACEEDEEKASGPVRERVVWVEKEGCATVVMYPQRRSAHLFLADGTVVTGDNQGAYQVFPSSTGHLQIQRDGKCVYSSDLLLAPGPEGGAPQNQPGSYTMSHSEDVACEVTDPSGNHFQVTNDGRLWVSNLIPTSSSLNRDEEELEEEKEEEEEEEEEEEGREMTGINVKHREGCPRLFVVHEDGSATEFLSSVTVEELLSEAYADPTVALLREALPDTQDDFGITILKPGHPSVWSQWSIGKQKPDICPVNLRDRSWDDFPATERKKPGPRFGTTLGRGLTLRESSGRPAAQRQPCRSCPRVLEIRELSQHRPLTTPLKHTVDARLKQYIEGLMEREQRSEEIKVKDPRTEEESSRASDLLNLVLSFAEEEETGSTFDMRSSVDIANLYSQGIGASLEHSDVSEETATVMSDSFLSGKESKWNDRLGQHRHEMCEEEACRDALRNMTFVPYFHPENVPLYQNLLQQQSPDMRRLSMDLPPLLKSPEDFLKDAPQTDTPRPLNPTPSQSARRAAGSERKPEEQHVKPSPLTSGKSSVRRELTYTSQVDVTGKPRKNKAKSQVLNQQSLSADQRKRRSLPLLTGTVVPGGFQLFPSRLDFGTLQEGAASTATVRMKNVGFISCRFHVKQPPPATGLRVIYSPGPVAAGLHVDLHVHLVATCGVQAGQTERKKDVSQDVIINTEGDVLHLPVTATILPQSLYDIWLRDNKRKKGFRVRQLSSSPPSGPRRGQPPPHPPQQLLNTAPFSYQSL